MPTQTGTCTAERYCTGQHDDEGCLLAAHVEWCTGRHNRDRQCQATAGHGVIVLGSPEVGGSYVSVETNAATTAELDALIATLTAVRAAYGAAL